MYGKTSRIGRALELAVMNDESESCLQLELWNESANASLHVHEADLAGVSSFPFAHEGVEHAAVSSEQFLIA